MAQDSVQGNIGTYKAAIRACEKGKHWQHALALLSSMEENKVERDTADYNVVISTSGKHKAWTHALALFSSMSQVKVCVIPPGLSRLDMGTLTPRN